MQHKFIVVCVRVVGRIHSLITDAFQTQSERHAEALAIERCLARMPSARMEYLSMHKEEGLKYFEIAERKGVHKEIVLKELTRAYADLRMSQIGDGDGDGEPAIAPEAEAIQQTLRVREGLACVA